MLQKGNGGVPTLKTPKLRRRHFCQLAVGVGLAYPSKNIAQKWVRNDLHLVVVEKTPANAPER